MHGLLLGPGGVRPCTIHAMQEAYSAKTIAGVRIATSVFFLLFGEYKIAGPAFAHGGFQNYLQGYISHDAVSFYRPFLAGVVQPHAVFFGYVVGWLEFLVGISLLLGLYIRIFSVVGALFLFNITLSSWWAPGDGAPLWRYFGSALDTLPLILLMIVFFAADAGRTWGLDGLRKA